MATLLILIVGFLHLVNVELAPAPLTSPRIDTDMFQIPVLDNRFNFDDKRQNWGLLINGSIYTENEDVSYNRPITIPRLYSTSTPLSSEKKLAKPQADAIPETSVSFKAKRFLQKSSEVNSGLKVINNEPKKTRLQCDVERIKCCINESEVSNCPIASECLKLEYSSDLCDTKVLQESINRVLNSFS
ncbi:uncharacterized protein LOC123867564 [Maniola jurtina]|uniref:uncharacterized protein LOC123867564 n=1 Tax=Maniola jurtina TaxID=191418 RepID=UPI001E687F40|nr:uncharacterized protein LOC123867564 [Maniola jurtina]